jgi:hypothetical protein
LSLFSRAILSPKNGSKQFEPFFFNRFDNGSTHQVFKTRIDPFFQEDGEMEKIFKSSWMYFSGKGESSGAVAFIVIRSTSQKPLTVAILA